ncbi:HlyD family type I secretion periplasmic adaptor subunit [Magnetospira sp. QH-2]|uniref:HlyD family type I secretion periplasmic adaptor subunit n=1 Tax=Magnetospira sp. (strain QH-2) TaxID=1288970 RepID=UPI0003E81AF5|nr:HlyD family type I secretion periplasmic adaptor subunit [Magnetospira sp. QH-2]CCQ72473.1 Type I secretion membrane fusion protein, HlyD family [Magnetospira sp. QH-2]
MTETTMDQEITLVRAKRQLRFLGQSALLEEAGVSLMSNAMIVIISAVLFGFIAWAHFTDVDEIAVGFGAVVPLSSVHVVQHLEGGIIREIPVKERQLVTKGTPLIHLDATQVQSDLDQTRSREAVLKLRAERLRALAQGRAPDYSAFGDEYATLVEDQLQIHQGAVQRFDSQNRVFVEQLQQKTEEIHAVREQQAAVKRQITLYAEEQTMRQDLFDKGVGSKLRVIEIKREVAAAENEMSRLIGQERTVRKEMSEVKERISDLHRTQQENALNEMGTVTAELAQVSDALQRIEDRLRRLVVYAPVSGIVQNLQFRTVGGVVPAGGQIVEIVPVDDELLVETRISTRDIGHVKEGQPVTVKVTSFDFARYGALEGDLESVSATTFIDEQSQQPYYKGMVRLHRNYVGNDPKNNIILPGMTVQADIITGNKTLLEYLLKPIYVSLEQAFHER